ncbi:GGDEF domain-containing protein [Alteromonas confluentis]|uniref:diguanylate cyclase n=1 Tax=Alteromonas confluentis TaxID=1656094 RepID=A0A1E7ZCV7_9ALTE|nr:GGDEF domain-containing protein [Alteromonas confluentis]OFC71301.1 hypothetical protein BFC18_09095 [Alteromonas confluentis]
MKSFWYRSIIVLTAFCSFCTVANSQDYDLADNTTPVFSKQLTEEQAAYLAKTSADAKLAIRTLSLEKQQLVATQELAALRQRSLYNMFVLGSLVSALLLIFLCWGRYEQYRQNRFLAAQIKARTSELELKNTELEAANKALERVSMRDPLTGLNNRNFLNAHLPGEITRVQHYYASAEHLQHATKQDLLCFLVDIDHFKRINDEYGHLAGDQVLVQFTQVLKTLFRSTDLLVRWGGEEFLIICRQADRRELTDLANRLIEAVRQKRFIVANGEVIHLTCSVGFSALPLWPERSAAFSWEQTFSLTDYCLYAAKISQRDCWVGVENATGAFHPTDELTPIAHRFGISGTNVKTSLNNLASIYWPD